MAHEHYKITITEQDYYFTTYTTWVSGTSKTQAIAKAGALAGQAKTRRAYERTGRAQELIGEELLNPSVKIEKSTVDEYYEHQDKVEIDSIEGRTWQ